MTRTVKGTISDLRRVGVVKKGEIVAPVVGEVKRSYIATPLSFIYIKRTSKRHCDSVGAHITKRETSDADWTLMCADSKSNYRGWENRPVNIEIKGRKTGSHLGVNGAPTILVELHFTDNNTTERAYMVVDDFNTVLEFETVQYL